nr:MAG TPA: HOMING ENDONUCLEASE I-DMOI [Caudoviricetes sp.]
MIDREYLYENYIVKNKSQRQIAEELNIGEGTVDYWTRKYGFTFKKSDRDRLFNLKNIDLTDPIFCYYAGLVATDGYLDTKNHRIALRVCNDGSYDVLCRLRDYFEYGRDVFSYSRKSGKIAHELNIPNDKIFKELEYMGICGIKDYRTFSLDWYYASSSDCKRMFLRGVSDGDGNIRKTSGIFRMAMKSESFILNLLNVFNNDLDFKDKYDLKFQTNSTGVKYPALELHKQDSISLYKFIYVGYEDFRFLDKYNTMLNFR